MLIIQKEFADFADTKERLDLLALDKQGSLVLIENKLDSGRDVTWQALKYASYCSSLSKDNIRSIFQEYLDKSEPGRDAKKILVEFLDAGDYDEIILNKGSTQRIVLIAANFRKEVTSTVLWLLSFQLRIQCFRVRPWKSDRDLFLGVDQIIPIKDAEEFMIGLASKSLDEVKAVEEEMSRERVRSQFWTKLLKDAAPKIPRFANTSPSDRDAISAGAGIGDFQFKATNYYARVELWIGRGNRERNKAIFNELYKQKDSIQKAFDGELLIWERMDEKIASRIKVETDGNVFDEAQWPAMISFMVDAMIRFERSLEEPLERIRQG